MGVALRSRGDAMGGRPPERRAAVAGFQGSRPRHACTRPHPRARVSAAHAAARHADEGVAEEPQMDAGTLRCLTARPERHVRAPVGEHTAAVARCHNASYPPP